MAADVDCSGCYAASRLEAQREEPTCERHPSFFVLRPPESYSYHSSTTYIYIYSNSEMYIYIQIIYNIYVYANF